MQNFLSESDHKWLEETFAKFDLKMEKECERLGDKIPYIPQNGHYEEDWGDRDIAWWTNGFWGGILWQMYHATGKEVYRQKAENVGRRLDRSMEEYEGL